jgi:hypothetical protein
MEVMKVLGALLKSSKISGLFIKESRKPGETAANPMTPAGIGPATGHRHSRRIPPTVPFPLCR